MTHKLMHGSTCRGVLHPHKELFKGCLTAVEGITKCHNPALGQFFHSRLRQFSAMEGNDPQPE